MSICSHRTARWHGGCLLFYPLFKTSAQKVTFFFKQPLSAIVGDGEEWEGCEWAKKVWSARTKRLASAMNEPKCDCSGWVWWACEWELLILPSFPLNWAQIDGHLVHVPHGFLFILNFCLASLDPPFCFSPLLYWQCAYIVSRMLWWCILCLASIIPSECCMVCVLYFLVTWPVSVNFDVDDIFSGHWGGETWVMV